MLSLNIKVYILISPAKRYSAIYKFSLTYTSVTELQSANALGATDLTYSGMYIVEPILSLFVVIIDLFITSMLKYGGHGISLLLYTKA